MCHSDMVGVYISSLKIGEIDSSENAAPFCETTGPYISQDVYIYIYIYARSIDYKNQPVNAV